MDVPEGANREDCLRYVMDAVESWKGGYHPKNPMFELDRSSISAQYVTTQKKHRKIVRMTSED